MFGAGSVPWFQRFEVTRVRREWTPDRIKAAQRAVEREAEKMALFPEMRRVTTVEDRQADMDAREERMTNHLRSKRAKAWCDVRRRLRSLAPDDRTRVVAKWNTRMMPGTPANLAAIITMLVPNAVLSNAALTTKGNGHE
jgi:hypothetical protein